MKIGIASDHRGYELKKKLIKYLNKKNEVIDYGTDSGVVVDYVDYAEVLCKGIKNDELDFGILICGTGIGMSIAANKVNGIMCAKIDNEEEAYYAKAHNNANVISISAKKNILIIKDMIDKFMQTEYLDQPNYNNRIKKIQKLEKNVLKQQNKNI